MREVDIYCLYDEDDCPTEVGVNLVGQFFLRYDFQKGEWFKETEYADFEFIGRVASTSNGLIYLEDNTDFDCPEISWYIDTFLNHEFMEATGVTGRIGFMRVMDRKITREDPEIKEAEAKHLASVFGVPVEVILGFRGKKKKENSFKLKDIAKLS